MPTRPEQMAEHLQNMLLQYTLRAKMPWIFGNAKQIQKQHPSLCAPQDI
jgi:hypothetical protein